MNTVLITGVSGFIGCVVAKSLLNKGWQIRGTCRSAEHVSGIPDTDWSKALNGLDAVVHLAARVHIMNDMESDPLAEFRYVNVAATKRLAQTAAATGCRRFVYMSSVKVKWYLERNQKVFKYNLPISAQGTFDPQIMQK